MCPFEYWLLPQYKQQEESSICPLQNVAFIPQPNLCAAWGYLEVPTSTLVLVYGTIVPTPWFWHATVSQTNARNASSELAAMFPVFQRGAEALLPFSRIHAAPHVLAVPHEQWICSSGSTITTFILILVWFSKPLKNELTSVNESWEKTKQMPLTWREDHNWNAYSLSYKLLHLKTLHFMTKAHGDSSL